MGVCHWAGKKDGGSSKCQQLGSGKRGPGTLPKAGRPPHPAVGCPIGSALQSLRKGTSLCADTFPELSKLLAGTGINSDGMEEMVQASEQKGDGNKRSNPLHRGKESNSGLENLCDLSWPASRGELPPHPRLLTAGHCSLSQGPDLERCSHSLHFLPS